MSELFISSMLKLFVFVCNPILFGVVLLFDNHAWNKDMFYTLSGLTSEATDKIFVGLLINICTAIALGLVNFGTVDLKLRDLRRKARTKAPGQEDGKGAGITRDVDQGPSKSELSVESLRTQ